jgi:hypothetical protein
LCVPILDFTGVEWSTMQSLGEEILAERLTPWRERYRNVWPTNTRQLRCGLRPSNTTPTRRVDQFMGLVTR